MEIHRHHHNSMLPIIRQHREPTTATALPLPPSNEHPICGMMLQQCLGFALAADVIIVPAPLWLQPSNKKVILAFNTENIHGSVTLNVAISFIWRMTRDAVSVFVLTMQSPPKCGHKKRQCNVWMPHNASHNISNMVLLHILSIFNGVADHKRRF